MRAARHAVGEEVSGLLTLPIHQAGDQVARELADPAGGALIAGVEAEADRYGCGHGGDGALAASDEGLGDLGFQREEGGAVDVQRIHRGLQVALLDSQLQLLELDTRPQVIDGFAEGEGDVQAEFLRQLPEELLLRRAAGHAV
ncbi:hypothetical protein D3C86_1562310 [compost metagenome]